MDPFEDKLAMPQTRGMQGLGLLLIMAYPLMHLFGHRQGGHHHSAEAPRASDSTPRKQG